MDDAIDWLNEEVRTFAHSLSFDPWEYSAKQFAIIGGPNAEEGGAFLYRVVQLFKNNNYQIAPEFALGKDERIVAYYTSPKMEHGATDDLFPLYARAWNEKLPVIQYDIPAGETTMFGRIRDEEWGEIQGVWVADTSSTVPDAKKLVWKNIQQDAQEANPPSPPPSDNHGARFWTGKPMPKEDVDAINQLKN